MKLPVVVSLATALLSACQAMPKRADYTVKNEVEIRVPAGAKSVRVWMALPQEDASQQVSGLHINCPVTNRITKDSEGNSILYAEASSPAQGVFTIATSFDILRSEDRHQVNEEKTRPLNEAEQKTFAKELSGNANVVLSQEVRDLSAHILAGEKNPVAAARKLYDWTLKNIDFWIKTPANHAPSPMGSSDYCLANKTGNANDFASLYAALARSAGIPARILYGSLLVPGADGTDIDKSSNCWVEVYAPQLGWIPIDVAEADIFVGDFNLTRENDTLVRSVTAASYHGPDPLKVQYYFGNLEERRVLWSVGRDLELDPKTASGAINALPKAYVEIDGQMALETTVWNRKLTFTQLK